MAKFAKPFHGVPNGAIYPVEYTTGEECPQELEAAARALGALVQEQRPAKGKDKA